MWVAKCVAAAKHSLVTLVCAIVTYILVFYVWYPDVFARLMPGTKLFLLVLCVEVVLGPCISLVIFNPAKSRRELVVDYLVVGSIQLGALVYGVLSVVDSRPVYVVFVKDRLEIVSAAELDKSDLLEASSQQFSEIPWSGLRFICVREPRDTAEKERLLFDEIPSGKDVQHLPRFYRECDKNELSQRAFAISKLKSIAAMRDMDAVSSELMKLDDNKIWLPIMGKMGVWVAIFDRLSSAPIRYIQFDPF
ncbi:TfpX/TfpZ family type IV pilin accessory protein [Cellvibrio sp. QJXJ]|uniref:TfpX/TfpZ family type IV pilin accessory protein n=1 Tax=Cellvibrio sp. QJXJ TaxID=2964606 RepID=UPI0021C264E3|nr:TfpX/TfpZ family type IV pilin accessory protein [Cellvibrio sp. QJXJ]UUA72396.1 hypothetical protein NNX04_18560 [Cellvibrio sp. QJXJ]